jgi:hypothetical protein
MNEKLQSKKIRDSGRVSQWVSALRRLRELKRAQVKPGIITCSAAITACGQATQWVGAFALLGVQ